MTDCPYHPHGDYWLCPECGSIKPRRGPVPPKRRCGRSSPMPATRDVALLAAWIEARVLADGTPGGGLGVLRELLAARLPVCVACERFEPGRGCADRQSGCGRPTPWVYAVAGLRVSGACDRWLHQSDAE